MKLLNRVAAVVLGAKLVTLAVNLVTFPRLKPGGRVKVARVSLLIPARNEEGNLARNLPALMRQGASEVMVLDDQSSDATAAVARAAGAAVLAGTPLPAGWRGKNWACHQLARAARGDVLVFTDADVQWSPGALDAVVTQLQDTGAGLFSVFPRQRNESVGERLLTPLVDNVLLSLFPAPLLRVPSAAASAANGQVMVFRREAYQQSGGHAGVRGELLEDVQLGRKVKGSGERLALALGADLIGVRMYGSYPQSVVGFAKSLPGFHGNSRAVMLASWALYFITYTLPLFHRHGRPLLVAALLEGLLVRRITGRTKPADLLELLLTPFLPLLALPVFQRASRKEVEWKGRKYAQDRRL